jgi:hypothetical protein
VPVFESVRGAVRALRALEDFGALQQRLGLKEGAA